MCMVSFSRESNYSSLQKIKQFDGIPKWAYIAICDNCSHKCSWCYGGFNHNLDNQMSIEMFETVLEKCKQIGIKQITLTGGEPTEHKHFMTFVKMTNDAGFLLHIASHGEHITSEMAAELKQHNVRQVQINWQGLKHHDNVHGVVGSFDKQVAGIKHLVANDIEVTTTTTIGKYNLKEVKSIFQQAADLGVNRIRVWESTGVGNAFRKGLEAKEIFEYCDKEAKQLGYIHTLSYDPAYQTADVNVPCPQLTNLFMYITADGNVADCCAIPDGNIIANFLEDNSELILNNYLTFNKTNLEAKGMRCMAREDSVIPCR